MEIILEYIYTGSVKEESLTKDNTIEAFYAADYFQLSDLQNFITKTIKNINFAKKCSPELLSKVSETMLLKENDFLLNLLVETVAIIPLNNVEFGRLSITGLKYLLSITHEKETPFVTREYEVFRYSVILTAKQISDYAYRTFMDRLPALEQIENSIKVGNKSVIDHQKVANELEPLIKYIDFKRIKTQILANIIEPLEIIPTEIILSVYRFKALLNVLNFNDIRGKPYVINGIDYVWDESARGLKFIIKDNGKIVQAPYQSAHQNVRAKVALENDIFEWDVIIERECDCIWVGVCASENFNYEITAGVQFTGWVLGSNGCCSHFGNNIENYCPSFGDGTKVTVHLNMIKRTCSFTVNGIRYPIVSKWNNLPSKLYPVVSLCYPGRIRIQPHTI
ncbi:hypothetical protein GLOIN_2v1482344 [Rhizophagus clarus]|nr:hypothetical protein GLOIN_2v1482344 [Rhizophagus clarus]